MVCGLAADSDSVHQADKVLRILEQAAGHLRWKSIIHPRNPWARGSNLTGGYRLSCLCLADTAMKPYREAAARQAAARQ